MTFRERYEKMTWDQVSTRCEHGPTRISSLKHFHDLMRLIYAVLICLLALMTSAQCQQTAEDWFYQGLDLQEQNKYIEAIKAYDEAIRINPNLATAWSNKGVAFYGQGKYDEAIKAFDEAVRIDPNLATAWNTKGIVLQQLGRTNEADAALAKAKALGYGD